MPPYLKKFDVLFESALGKAMKSHKKGTFIMDAN